MPTLNTATPISPVASTQQSTQISGNNNNNSNTNGPAQTSFKYITDSAYDFMSNTISLCKPYVKNSAQSLLVYMLAATSILTSVSITMGNILLNLVLYAPGKLFGFSWYSPITMAEYMKRNNTLELIKLCSEEKVYLNEIEALLKSPYGVDINNIAGYKCLFTKRTSTIKYPIHEACDLSTNSQLVEKLIKAGANVDIQCPDYKLTPLQKAVINGREAVVTMLLQNGAKPDLVFTDDNITYKSFKLTNKDTALILAAKSGYARIFNEINAKVTDINQKDAALEAAIKAGNKDIIEILVKENKVTVTKKHLKMVCDKLGIEPTSHTDSKSNLLNFKLPGQGITDKIIGVRSMVNLFNATQGIVNTAVNKARDSAGNVLHNLAVAVKGDKNATDIFKIIAEATLKHSQNSIMRTIRAKQPLTTEQFEIIESGTSDTINHVDCDDNNMLDYAVDRLLGLSEKGVTAPIEKKQLEKLSAMLASKGIRIKRETLDKCHSNNAGKLIPKIDESLYRTINDYYYLQFQPDIFRAFLMRDSNKLDSILTQNPGNLLSKYNTQTNITGQQHNIDNIDFIIHTLRNYPNNLEYILNKLEEGLSNPNNAANNTKFKIINQSHLEEAVRIGNQEILSRMLKSTVLNEQAKKYVEDSGLFGFVLKQDPINTSIAKYVLNECKSITTENLKLLAANAALSALFKDALLKKQNAFNADNSKNVNTEISLRKAALEVITTAIEAGNQDSASTMCLKIKGNNAFKDIRLSVACTSNLIEREMYELFFKLETRGLVNPVTEADLEILASRTKTEEISKILNHQWSYSVGNGYFSTTKLLDAVFSADNITSKHMELAKYIIEHNFSAISKNAVRKLIKSGNVNMLSYILKNSQNKLDNPAKSYLSGSEALSDAIKTKDFNIIKLIISNNSQTVNMSQITQLFDDGQYELLINIIKYNYANSLARVELRDKCKDKLSSEDVSEEFKEFIIDLIKVGFHIELPTEITSILNRFRQDNKATLRNKQIAEIQEFYKLPIAFRILKQAKDVAEFKKEFNKSTMLAQENNGKDIIEVLIEENKIEYLEAIFENATSDQEKLDAKEKYIKLAETKKNIRALEFLMKSDNVEVNVPLFNEGKLLENALKAGDTEFVDSILDKRLSNVTKEALEIIIKNYNIETFKKAVNIVETFGKNSLEDYDINSGLILAHTVNHGKDEMTEYLVSEKRCKIDSSVFESVYEDKQRFLNFLKLATSKKHRDQIIGDSYKSLLRHDDFIDRLIELNDDSIIKFFIDKCLMENNSQDKLSTFIEKIKAKMSTSPSTALVNMLKYTAVKGKVYIGFETIERLADEGLITEAVDLSEHLKTKKLDFEGFRSRIIADASENNKKELYKSLATKYGKKMPFLADRITFHTSIWARMVFSNTHIENLREINTHLDNLQKRPNTGNLGLSSLEELGHNARVEASK